MACYGYPWPEILRCEQFPMDHGMCISTIGNDTRTGKKVPRASCRDCELDESSSAKEILETFCANDFTAKIRITKRNTSSSSISDFDMDSRVDVMRHGSLSRGDVLPRLQQWLDLDATCVQNIMRGTRTGTYVVSGDVQEDKVVVHHAYAWQRRHKNLHIAAKKWKHHKCRS